MATMSIRSTYSLDEDTVRRLDAISRQWGVSKSEALRRAIRSVGAQPPPSDRLAALTALQGAVRLSDPRARAWMHDARDQRRAASAKRGR